MPNQRRSHRSELQNPGCWQRSDPIQTSGEFLPDGSVVELIRDASSGELRLLWCAGKDSRLATEFEFGGRSYRAPDLSSSMARAIPLPSSNSAYGSTEDLFGATLAAFSLYAISAEAARACTYFVFAAWCHRTAQPPPILTISGPPAEATRLLQVVACVVRRGLSVVELTSPGLATIVELLQPTLIIDARHLSAQSRRLLAASCRPGAYLVTRNSVVDLGVPRVLYVGPQPDPELSIDFALHVHLPASPDGHRLLTGREQKQLLAEFQPRFLGYRIRNLSVVRDSEFDVPELTDESRVVAGVLGACIEGAPGIQSGVRTLFEDRELEIRENRFTDPACIVIEVLLAHCHDPKRDEVRVKEVAEGTNSILKARGEIVEIDPRAVGPILDKLGVRREPRNRLGRRILLNARIKRRIHTLARDHKVESIEQVMSVCKLCKEVFGNNADPTKETAA
jgi:hypothetical protein